MRKFHRIEVILDFWAATRGAESRLCDMLDAYMASDLPPPPRMRKLPARVRATVYA